MKALIAWWAKNPVAGNLLMLACAIFGFMSYTQMDKEFFPGQQAQQIRVEAVWPGATPEDVERQIVSRIEEAVVGIDGVQRIRSQAGEGYGWVVLRARPTRDIEQMLDEVRNSVNAISGLPRDLEPLQVRRDIFRNWSILTAVHGPNATERQLQEAAELVRDQLARQPGVNLVIVAGKLGQEVSIELSEEAMRRYGLTFDEVAQAVRGASVDLSGGTVKTASGSYQLRAKNLAESQKAFEAIVVRQTEGGGVVRVGDVARVIDGYVDTQALSRQNGEPAIMVTVLTAERFNLFQASDSVHKFIKEMNQPGKLPNGLSMSIVYDESTDYRALLDILFQNALTGFALIFILLLLTLHPTVAFWSTLGVMTAFAGSFIILPYVDVSLNFLTVFGFLLVLGIMVDDAIIVGEAIYERIEKGERGADAAILATQMVLKPLLASVLVTVLAFAPWMFITGEERQFTRAMSIVVMSTLFFSLIETLIILPAHLAHVKPLQPGPGFWGTLAGWQVKSSESVLWFSRNIYQPLVRLAVKKRYTTLAVFIVSLALAVTLMSTGRIKQSFMPEIEGDFVNMSITLPAGTPAERTKAIAEELEAGRARFEQATAQYAYTRQEGDGVEVKSRGAVMNWYTVVEDRSIQAYINLTPPEARDVGTKKLLEIMRESMGEFPDAEQVNYSLGGGDDGSALDIALSAADPAELRRAVEELKDHLSSYAQVYAVSDSEDSPTEELRLTLRPGAEQLGLNLADVTRQVRQAYFGEEVQRLARDGQDARVYVRYPRADRRTLDSLNEFRVRTPDGREIPLWTVANARFEPGSTSIDRRDRMRSIVVSAEAPQEARADIQKALGENYWPSFEERHPTVSRRDIGQAQGQQEFFGEFTRLLGIASFAMFFLLAVVFRSYVQPALIMSALPFAFVGAAVGHFVTGSSFALFSWLGLVAAAGVVVNDNVVLLDRANNLRQDEGLDAEEGIIQAGVSRFRQIFLTSVTEFVGTAPMLLENSVNAQFLKPMIVSLAFGVLLCMPVTLLLTPALYMIGKDVKTGVTGLWASWRGAVRGARSRIEPAE
jgi:multidrug efflux pump subunit AcrB